MSSDGTEVVQDGSFSHIQQNSSKKKRNKKAGQSNEEEKKQVDSDDFEEITRQDVNSDDEPVSSPSTAATSQAKPKLSEAAAA